MEKDLYGRITQRLIDKLLAGASEANQGAALAAKLAGRLSFADHPFRGAAESGGLAAHSRSDILNASGTDSRSEL